MSISGLTQKYARDIGVSVSQEQSADFETYAEYLIDWNKKINLTAITDADQVAIKHFSDSLTLLPLLPQDKPFSLIDVGTGAGFPGIPLAIMRKDINITLLDSLNKRIEFLKAVTQRLNLNITAVHGRAEDLSKTPDYREKFDFATARAVSNLSSLCEYTLPFVRVGGYFIAMKGRDVEDEIASAQNAISLLSGEIEEVKSVDLPDGSQRNLIIIKKISQTSPKYPRSFTKISKNPL